MLSGPIRNTFIIKMSSFSRKAVAVVVLNEQNEVLLCKRSYSKKDAPGKWRLPGGGIEKKESILEATVREIGEELSAKVINFQETPVILNYSIDGKRRGQAFFVYSEITGDIKLNHENIDFMFVPQSSLEKYVENEWLEPSKKSIEWIIEEIILKNRESL